MSQGKLYRPGGPKGGEPCEVTPGRLGLDVVPGDGVSIPLPYDRLDGKVAGYDDSYVVLGVATDAGRLEVWLDRTFVAELAGYENSFNQEFRRRFAALRGAQRRGSATRVFSRVAGLLIVVGSLWFVFGGGLARLVVALTPVAVEEAIGAVAVDDMLEQYPPCADTELTAAVQDILTALVDQVPDNPYSFELHVVQSPDVNAFALPGGGVFVMSGLLEAADDPAEVAAVLGHEMQHVLGRHTMLRMVHRAGIGVALGMVFGDSSEFIATIGAMAADLKALEFGRGQESESDATGLHLLARAGFDPTAPARFWARMAEARTEAGAALESALALLSSHPPSAERNERLTALAANLPRPDTPRMADLDWATLKGRCPAE
jgi:Zn-dependent protease with chaperone function